MGLDGGNLTRLDRKLLAGRRQDETNRMVRVPVTPAKWSTSKQHCDSTGVSMDRAVVKSIDQELISTFGDLTGDDPSVLADQAEMELARRLACWWVLPVGAHSRMRDFARRAE